MEKIDISKQYRIDGYENVSILTTTGDRPGFPVIAQARERNTDNWFCFAFNEFGRGCLTLLELKLNRKLEGWVNVYEDGSRNSCNMIHKTREDAEKSKSPRRIACLDLSKFSIEYEEGEGL